MIEYYVKIAREGLGCYYVPFGKEAMENLASELEVMQEYSDEEDVLLVSMVQMDEEEYAAMPEFSGW